METIKTTSPNPYAGLYVLRNKTGSLVSQVWAKLPRLYETVEAATAAAESITWAGDLAVVQYGDADA